MMSQLGALPGYFHKYIGFSLGLGNSIDSVNIAIVSLLSRYDIANRVITIETMCVF